MSFIFAYTLDGDSTGVVKDYPLDTIGNFPVAGQLKGTLVKLASGLLQRCGTGAAGTGGIGVMEGIEFTGLIAQGQPYAAKNTSFTASITDTTRYANGMGKVRIDKTSAVYKVKASAAVTNSHVGGKYGITLTGTDQIVNLADTTNQAVTVVDIDIPNQSLYVTIL